MNSINLWILTGYNKRTAGLPGSGSNPGDEDDPDDEATNKRRFLVDGRLVKVNVFVARR